MAKVLWVCVIFTGLGWGQSFPRSTKIELGVAGGMVALDGWSSSRWHPNEEQNPLLRPLLTSPGKTAGYFGGGYGALVGTNYLLRNHPRFRHALNWVVIGGEGYLASRNFLRQKEMGR